MPERLLNPQTGLTTERSVSSGMSQLIFEDEKLLSVERGRLCEAVERNILCGLVADKHKHELIEFYDKKNLPHPSWLDRPVSVQNLQVPIYTHRKGLIGKGKYEQISNNNGLVLTNSQGMHHNAPGVIITGDFAGLVVDHVGDPQDWEQGLVANRVWHSRPFTEYPYEPYFQVPAIDMFHATEEAILAMIGNSHQRKVLARLWQRFDQEVLATNAKLGGDAKSGDVVISLLQDAGYPVSFDTFATSIRS